MPPKPAKLDKVDTKLIKDFHIDIEERPTHIKNWFSNNIISRVLAYLVGLGDDNKFHLIKTDGNGNIRVVDTKKLFSEYKVYSLNVTSENAQIINFDKVYNKIYIRVDDGTSRINLKLINEQYGDDIFISEGEIFSEYIQVKGIKVNPFGSYSTKLTIMVFR